MGEKKCKKKILIYGFGNPGRNDDGLGNFLVESLEKDCEYNLVFDTNYQINAEDSLLISQFDIVFFVDASENEIESFKFSEVSPDLNIAFSTHAMTLGSVLSLCNELYSKFPQVYLLEIKGYDWDIGEHISKNALHNLEKAKEFLKKKIASYCM